MSTEYAIAMTTVSNHAEADKIAKSLLASRLAACIQVTQIQSYYTWKGEVNIDDERLLLIKCKRSDFAELVQCIHNHHSYQVPEIIQVPITSGLPAYFHWIDEVTSKG